MNEARLTILRYRLERAENALALARHLADIEEWEACVNRLYYACFYAANAWMLTAGLSSSKHRGVRSLLNEQLVKPGLLSQEMGALYNVLFARRQRADYEDLYYGEPNLVRTWIPQVRTFVDAIRAIIDANLRKSNQ